MKTCPNCGQPALDWHRFCMRCGIDISAVQAFPAASQQYATQNPPQAAPDAYAPQAAPQQYNAVPPTSSGSNKTLIIVAVAVIAVVLIPVILIVAAIAIPNFLRARISANEASAVGSVRTINTGATAYQAQFHHYPEGLASMGSPVAGVSPEYGAGLIDNTLASGKKSGYVFSYHGIDSKHSGVLDDYEVSACPERPNQSGVRCFYSDSSGVIHYSRAGPANKESPALDD